MSMYPDRTSVYLQLATIDKWGKNTHTHTHQEQQKRESPLPMVHVELEERHYIMHFTRIGDIVKRSIINRKKNTLDYAVA